MIILSWIIRKNWNGNFTNLTKYSINVTKEDDPYQTTAVKNGNNQDNLNIEIDFLANHNLSNQENHHKIFLRNENKSQLQNNSFSRRMSVGMRDYSYHRPSKG